MSAIHGFTAAHLPSAAPAPTVDSTAEGDVPASAVPANSASTQKVTATVAGQSADNSNADKTSPNENLQLLTDSEVKQVEQLKQRDREVKAHEAAHLAAAGQHATSGAKFTYTRGPDGRSYAIGGSVGIDLSAEADPEATVRKADQIKRAALAPAEPSSQDRSVAAAATALRVKAQADLVKLRAEEQRQADEVGVSGAESTGVGEPFEDVENSLSTSGEGNDKSVSETSEQTDQSSHSCAVCGGSHGSEGHVNANRKKLEGSYGETLLANEADSSDSLLSLLA